MLSLITSLLSNSGIRKAFLYIVIIGSLAIGGFALYHHIYESGYNTGVSYQTSVYTGQQEKAKALLAQEQKQADADRADLNKQISDLQTQASTLQAQLDKKYSQQTQEVTDYAKTADGSESCFKSDSDGLRIINNSFPDSN